MPAREVGVLASFVNGSADRVNKNNYHAVVMLFAEPDFYSSNNSARYCLLQYYIYSKNLLPSTASFSPRFFQLPHFDLGCHFEWDIMRDPDAGEKRQIRTKQENWYIDVRFPTNANHPFLMFGRNQNIVKKHIQMFEKLLFSFYRLCYNSLHEVARYVIIIKILYIVLVSFQLL